MEDGEEDYWRWFDGMGGDYWRLLGGGLFEVVGWRGEKRIIGGGWVWGGGLRIRILKGLVGRG